MRPSLSLTLIFSVLSAVLCVWLYVQLLTQISSATPTGSLSAPIVKRVQLPIRATDHIIQQAEYHLIPPPTPTTKPTPVTIPVAQKIAVQPKIKPAVAKNGIPREVARPKRELPKRLALPPELLGVVAETDRAWALLASKTKPQGEWVTLDNTFEGWIVKEILPKSVLVEQGKQTKTLNLLIR